MNANSFYRVLVSFLKCQIPLIGIIFSSTFTSCGDSSIKLDLLGIQNNQDPVKDLSGCYRVRIRHIACMVGCNKWWEIKNVCYDQNGNWIESNGLNFKYGVVKSNGVGVFSIDTAEVSFFPDSANNTLVKFNGYSHYKTDTTQSIFTFDLDGTNFEIYGGIPSKLDCWEFIYPDSMMDLWNQLSLPKPLMCQKTFQQIFDSSNYFDKNY